MSCDINADLHLDAGLWSLIPGVCHMTFPILGHGPTVHFGMSIGTVPLSLQVCYTSTPAVPFWLL